MTATVTPLKTFTIAGREFARVITNVIGHAGHNDALPVLDGIWFIPTGTGFAVAATDRFTFTVCTGQLSHDGDRTAAPDALITLRAGAAPVCGVPAKELKPLIAAAKKAFMVTVTLTPATVTVIFDDATFTLDTIVGQFPNYGALVPDDASLGSSDLPDGVRFDVRQLAKYTKVAGNPIPTAGRPAPATQATTLTFRFVNATRPALVTCGPTFAGLIMPVR